jgi:hypothetical protein
MDDDDEYERSATMPALPKIKGKWRWPVMATWACAIVIAASLVALIVL